MIDDPLVAGDVTIVLLFFGSVEGEDLVDGGFFCSDLVSALCQHPQQTDHQNKYSVPMLQPAEPVIFLIASL